MPKATEGECMVSLADKLGMQDYHTLYDDGVNATLKRRRPNPNQLLIGDEWQDPPSKGKVHQKPVDKTWKFVVKPKKPPKLRIVVVDAENKPLAGKKWNLTAPKALSGTTKKDGLIEVPDLPPQEKNGVLEVTWQKTKPKKAAPAPKEPAITAPTYPRPIKPAEFTEDAPTAPSAADDVVQFTMKIGSLPTFNHDSGVRARLRSLGFGCRRGSDNERTKKCVELFQRVHLKQNAPSGRVSDVRNDVRDKHDNL
jgi:hypothetical protein